MTFWLVLQLLAFAAWVLVALRYMLRVRARAARLAGGRILPGIGATFDAFRQAATDPAFAADRRRLILMTLAVLGLAAAPILLGV
jgi:hypothetical protein